MSGGSLLGVSVLEIRTDQSALDIGLAQAKAKSTGTSREMQASMDLAGKATDAAALKLKGYQVQVASAQTRVNALGRALQSGRGDQVALNESLQVAQQRLSLAQGKLSAYSAEVAAGAGHTSRLTAETRSLSAETGISSRAFSDLTSHMGPAGRGLTDLTARSRLYREHGVDYLAAGVIGLETAFVGLSVRAAVRFEDLGSTVRRETGLTGHSLEDLMGTIRRVGRDSPYQMTQLADAAVVLRKVFHETDGQISTSANLMVAFATATGQQVRPEMQQLARIMTDYRAPLGQVVGLTDKLVAVSQATQQPISQITGGLDRVGPKLQALGFNLTDSIRLLGLFQASGINVDQMSRGLASALTSITKVQSANQKLLADGPAKLTAYGLAIDSARLRVQTLSTELASGKGNQQKLDAEMVIAQGRLTEVKGKYDALNVALATAKKAHGDIATTMHSEVDQVERAKSKQDALNLAIGFFGKTLGPTMARALYDNAAAAKKVDDALKNTGATQRLFGIDQKSLAGETQAAKNNFQDLEIEIGTKVVPALSHMLSWVRTGIHDIDDFYKKNKELVDVLGSVAGGISALTLLSRHSPLGNLLGGIAQNSGHAGLAGFLTGPGSPGTVSGIRGSIGAGSETNPVATFVVNQGKGGSGATPGEKAAVGDAAAVAEAKAAARLTAKVGGGAAAGVLGFAAMSHAQGTPLNQLNALAHGLDPTSVLHLIGLPSLSDLLPGVRQRHPLSAQDIADLGMGLTPGPSLNRVRSGNPITTGWQNTQIGAGNAPFARQSASVEQATRDFVAMNTALANLEQHKTGIAQTAKTLDGLAASARKAGDVKIALADTLGAEMLRTHSVTSKGVQDIVHQLDQLAPGARTAATQSMIDMAHELETSGRLPKGASAQLVTDLLTNFKGMRDKSGEYFQTLVVNAGTQLGKLRDTAEHTTGQARQKALAQIDALKTAANSGFDSMAGHVGSQMRSMANKIIGGSQTAANAAGQNLGDFEKSVQTAMASGVLSSTDGANKITQALNATLKAFGSKPIPLALLIASEPKSLPVFVGGGHAGHFATGGVMQIGRPGERGRDIVPLSVGGTDIMVGRGEKVAVFNGDQQRLMDHRLADYGGLTGMFSKVNRPHHLASGGWVQTGATIDPTGGQAPTYSAHGGFSFAELLEAGANAGRRPDLTQLLGEPRGAYGMPMETAIDIRMPGSKKTFQIWKNDVGSGQPSAHYTIDLHQAIASALGWSGNQDVQVARAGTDPNAAVTAAGGSAAAAVFKAITDPRVLGSGTVAAIVRAGLGKATAGANAYERKHMPAPAPSAGGGAIPGGGGATSGPGGLTTFEGVVMSQWIANELIWATQHGWHGQPTSGYRPGFDPHAPSGSEHALIAYPGGAVDFGGFTDPAAYATKLALVQLAARLNYPGPRLQMPIGFHDDGHLSGTGHARGGLVDLARAFASGGLVKMYDATGDTLGQIPKDAGAIASYVDHYGGYQKARGMFPHLPVVSISVTPGNNVPADIYDVEPGGKSVAETIAAISAGRAHGDYGGAGDLGSIRAGLGAKGIARDRYKEWLAAWPGSGQNVAGGYDAHQYASTSGYDTSVALPSFFQNAVGGSPAAASKKKAGAKKPVKAKPVPKAKPFPLPKLTGFPQFALAQMNELSAMDTTISGLQSWQGYLTTLNSSGAPLTPLVTLADGSEVVNWDGMIDPSTGQFAKGINARLAEIGSPGSAPNATATRDIHTELGIDETILDDYYREQKIAQSVAGNLTPWLGGLKGELTLDNARVAWLTAALDKSESLPKLADLFGALGDTPGSGAKPGAWAGYDRWGVHLPGSRVPWSSTILEKAEAYRNAFAQIAYLTRRKGELTAEKAARSAAIAERFAAAKQNVKNSSATGALDGSLLLKHQLLALDEERKAALPSTTVPPGWAGSKAGWTAQRKTEVLDIDAEFAARKLALQDSAARHKLTGSLSKSNALFGLSQEEADEKAALTVAIDKRRASITNQIAGDRATSSTDKSWLTALRASAKSVASTDKATLSTATGSGGTVEQLLAYTNPDTAGGTLALNIDQVSNIDIPALLQEIAGLKGTTVQASTSAAGGTSTADATLAANRLTLLIEAVQALAVSQAQYGELAARPLPPFGGSFAEGGIVPGPIGAARTIIAHGGEQYLGVGASGIEHTWRVIVQDGAVDPNKIRVIAGDEVNKRTRNMSRRGGRPLPGAGGGYQPVR